MRNFYSLFVTPRTHTLAAYKTISIGNSHVYAHLYIASNINTANLVIIQKNNNSR